MFVFPVRVYIEDTDLGGIVYYVNYLKFLERARTEFLRHRVLEQHALQQQGYIFVVKQLQCDYKIPAELDDLLQVSVEVAKLGSASVTFEQQVLRGEDVLSRACVEVVCVDAHTKRPRRFPSQIKQIFSA
ncbi:MAG: tol-pal system-associated acyl-CoA thioesterase [Pseudomonadales bacterium]